MGLELAERQEALPRLVKTWIVKDEDQALGWIQEHRTYEDASLFIGAAADHLGPTRSLALAKALTATPAREILLAHAYFDLLSTFP